MNNFYCLSGLPRTGSTLLSALLCQNPTIHAEGNSAVCQLVWDLSQSCKTSSSEQLNANNRQNTIYDLLLQIPKTYYKDITETIIIDKCRSWTMEPNINILKKYINPDFKVIVLERSIVDIVKSFAKLYHKNKKTLYFHKLLTPHSEPIMRSLTGIQWAKKNNQNNNFLFIQYNDLIQNTKETIDKIYGFLNVEPFEHDFDNIQVKYPEDDSVYQLKGQHDIRNKITYVKNDITIPDDILQKCITIDKLMGYKSE